jgi:hypothetical protein
LLFWLGGTAVAISLITGMQALAVPRLGEDFGRVALMFPAWGVLSLGLALLLRLDPENLILSVIGSACLLTGLAAPARFIRA